MKKILLPRITSPCSQDWSRMRGDEKRRFCEECQLYVHNLDALNTREQEELLAKRGDRHCVAYLTSEKTLRIPSGLWLLWRRGRRALRTGLAFGLIQMGCANLAPGAEPSPTPSPSPTPAATVSCVKSMGVGGIEAPPMWKRLLFFWRY